MKELLLNLREIVREGQCLISIAAGIPTSSIENLFRWNVRVVRRCPTPRPLRAGMTLLAGGISRAGKIKVCPPVFFFRRPGGRSSGKDFDAVTAVSGSGPAYLFYLAESLEKGRRPWAFGKVRRHAVQADSPRGGASSRGGDSARELRRRVTSPGGTTEAAIRFLEKEKWQEIFIRALRKAKERSGQISRMNR